MSQIKQHLEKLKSEVYPDIDVNHLVETLFKYRPNEWFMPDNADDFFVMQNLYGHNLICKKVIPLWNGGTFKGTRIYYLYTFEHLTAYDKGI